MCLSPQVEFCRDTIMFYRGEVQIIVYANNCNKKKIWCVSKIVDLVLGWGYVRNDFRVWNKLEGIDESFVEVNMDDRVVDVVIYFWETRLMNIYMLSIMWKTSIKKQLCLNALIRMKEVN